MMRRTVFTIGEYPQAYIGYTDGSRWNGWATPYFELAEALVIMAEYNAEDPESPIVYNKGTDTFVVDTMGGFDGDSWKGIDCQTEEGTKHLYGIGAYCWIWDEANDQDFLYLAQGIEDFIYEYEAKELYVDRKELVNNIQIQLKELITFQQVYETWHNDDLTEELKYKALGGILTL